MRPRSHGAVNIAAAIAVACWLMAAYSEAHAAPAAPPFYEPILEWGRQEVITSRIRAALADRKDIRSRYIRVRYDGETVQLAGFATNATQAVTAEGIARRVAPGAVVQEFWTFEPDLEEQDAYMTRIGEQAADAEIWARVQIALRSPAVRPLLANVDVQAVDVRHGKVRIYLILDKAGAEIDLAPHLRSIPGVTKVSVRTVTVTPPTAIEPKPD